MIRLQPNDLCDIISTIAMCSVDDSVSDKHRAQYCYNKIFDLTKDESVALHASDCISAIIANKNS